MTSRDDDPTARAASYALGALTDAERRELEAELGRNARLAAEVREFSETAAVLGLAPTPVVASDDLRARLLAQIEETPQLPNPVRELRRPWYGRPLTAIAVAAAAVVIAVGGTVTATTLMRDQTPSAVEQIIAAPDYERTTADIDGGGTITFVWSLSLERAAILVDDLAAPPEGRTYQMWFMDDEGNATPAGTFDTTDGRGMVLDAEMSPGDTIGMTLEPDGGSPAPTTDPLVTVATA